MLVYSKSLNLRRKPMKAGIMGTCTENHASDCCISIIDQKFQFFRHRNVEQLAVVLQHTAQKLTHIWFWLQRRVQATKLAVTRASTRINLDGSVPTVETNTQNRFSGKIAEESQIGIGREVMGQMGYGWWGWRRMIETIFHEQLVKALEENWREKIEKMGWLKNKNILGYG